MIAPMQTSTSQVVRFNPYVNDRPETHLEFTVFYVARDGRTRWANGLMHWDDYRCAQALQDKVLALQTDFVRERWVRIEVCTPNRDVYGHLQPGWVKDTGLLLATRQLH